MKEGSAIINSTSVNAFKGNATLLDYTATKGAITAFTRGLALQLVKRGIRVNCKSHLQNDFCITTFKYYVLCL